MLYRTHARTRHQALTERAPLCCTGTGRLYSGTSSLCARRQSESLQLYSCTRVHMVPWHHSRRTARASRGMSNDGTAAAAQMTPTLDSRVSGPLWGAASCACAEGLQLLNLAHILPSRLAADWALTHGCSRDSHYAITLLMRVDQSRPFCCAASSRPPARMSSAMPCRSSSSSSCILHITS